MRGDFEMMGRISILSIAVAAGCVGRAISLILMERITAQQLTSWTGDRRSDAARRRQSYPSGWAMCGESIKGHQ